MKKIVCAAFVALLSANTAGAAVFNFTFSSAGNAVLSSGSVTTSDTLNSRGGYNVLSISGVADGSNIVGLIADPNQPQTRYYNSNGTIASSPTATTMFGFDNTLYNSPKTYVDGDGLLFKTSNIVYNIYYDTTTKGYSLGYSALGSTQGNARPGTLSVSLASVPEPAAWAMFVVGFGSLGASMRRRKQVNATFA